MFKPEILQSVHLHINIHITLTTTTLYSTYINMNKDVRKATAYFNNKSKASLKSAAAAGTIRQDFSWQKLTQGCVKLFSTVSGTDRQPLRNKLAGHLRFCFIFKWRLKSKMAAKKL